MPGSLRGAAHRSAGRGQSPAGPATAPRREGKSQFRYGLARAVGIQLDVSHVAGRRPFPHPGCMVLLVRVLAVFVLNTGARAARVGGLGRGHVRLAGPDDRGLRAGPGHRDAAMVGSYRSGGGRQGRLARCLAPARRALRYRAFATCAGGLAWAGGFPEGSMDTCGRMRSSQPGSHQFARPGRCMRAGTRMVRRMKASSRTAAARPRPHSPIACWPVRMKALNTQIMMVAAAMMTRPVVAWPVVTAWWLSRPVPHSSWIRETRNTS